MANSARFRDWTELPSVSRQRKRARAVDYARALEPRLNAFIAFRDAGADFVADVLDGIPYAAKDIFFAPDRRPTGGLTKSLLKTPPFHADVLRCLDDAGGFCVGYTSMTELAYEPSGYNAVYGRVKNPWNLDFISGGSSSGSAAAVASGSVIIALGSDTGGSLRIPAQACGVTAWKPTWGLVPTAGAMALAPSLDTIGLLSRSARDMSAAAAVLAGLPQRAAASFRTATVVSDVLDATAPSVASRIRAGADAVESCGIKLELRAGMTAIEALDTHVFTIMQAEAARIHRSLIEGGSLDPVLKKRLAKGLKIDDQTLAASLATRQQLASTFLEQVFREVDILIVPVMPIRTPEAAICDPASPSFDAKVLYQLSRWTRFVNLLGFPAVAVPVGFDGHGMPVAMQIIGKPNSDLGLIALAATMQDRTDWHARVPSAVSDLAVAMCADEVS
jgi:aspartyl-tRNA(Asn)/glutamyl-tRNA(Gln) amidotransferase subunit A